MPTPRVVCVDDEPSFAELTATHLERHATVEAEGFTDPDLVLRAVEDDDVACVISDYDMPGMDGLEVLEAVRERNPDLPFVLYTGKGSEEVASEAISNGVTEYLQKSTDPSQYQVLANRVENAIERYRVEAELERQRTLVERIVETTPISLLVHEGSGDVVVANERARSLLHMDDESLHLRSYEASDWELYAADGTRLAEDDLPAARVIENDSGLWNESYGVEVDGVRFDIELNAEPLYDGDGELLYVVVAFTVDEELGDAAD